MKKSTFKACGAVLSGFIALALTHSGIAQTLTGTPPTNGVQATRTLTANASGSIVQVSPDLISIKADGDPAPTIYLVTKDTTYIDDQEAPVKMSVVRPGRAVVISYLMDGKNRVAVKVLVRNAP